jgi:hypothetical protein
VDPHPKQPRKNPYSLDVIGHTILAILHGYGEAAVRLTTTVVCIFLSFGPLTFGQSSRPVPAGMRDAQKWEAQSEKDFPPAKPSRATAKPETLQIEAKQLADLAASIPSGVESANKGLLDKELLKTLKDIEKLSKHLHDELKH